MEEGFAMGLVLGLSLATLVAMLIGILVERRRGGIIRDLRRFLGPSVPSSILRRPEQLVPRIREVTSYFAQVTRTQIPQGEVVDEVTTGEMTRSARACLKMLTDTILEHDGTIDSYRGDLVVAHWNGVEDQEEHAALACACALSQLAAHEEMNAELPARMQTTLRIGISTGMAIVGNVGSERQMRFSITGDTVDFGAKLENANKRYNTRVLISERTSEQLSGDFVTREIGRVRMPGLRRMSTIHELVSRNGQG